LTLLDAISQATEMARTPAVAKADETEDKRLRVAADFYN
jgi:hypothetical protein